MALAPGTRFGRYEIRSPLGAGGMGEVYLAQDTELERTVALKVLPEQVASDQQRMQRFVQEAKSASALNHPNILTIYEIGRADTVRFIATEFINGLTLRQQMTAANITLSEALNISIQICDALSAAHLAGILHRDIKPENVMVRPDGYVKVLDFGLAKLTERPLNPDTEAPTRALVHTDPGTVMGTARYMSPEQARALALDARTDIWSLGAVLYEMVAGRPPFEGASTGDVISAVLNKEPLPLARYQPGVPEALEWIVTKALTKDKEGRYQTAKELLTDLRRLKQRIEFDAEMERSVSPDRSSPTMSSMATMSGQGAAVETETREPAMRTAEVGQAHTNATSAEYLVSELKRHKGGAIALAAILVLALAGISFALYKFFGQRKSAPSFQNMKVTKLTNTGKVTIAAISPEGKYVVHAVDDGGVESLWVRQVATSSNVQIVAPAEASYRGITFSADGDYIFYVLNEKNSPISIVYQLPILGGAPRKLLEDIDGSMTLSPDGRRFAFVRNYPSKRESVLFIANSDGSNEQSLAVRKSPDEFRWGTRVGPAWSPDGKIIACPVRSGGDSDSYETVVAVQVAGGAEKPITTQKWKWVGQVTWLHDGSGLILTAQDESPNSSGQIWNLSFPDGEVRKVTNDLNNYRGVSITADSRTMVTVQSVKLGDFWVAPNGSAGNARQITSNKSSDGSAVLSWTPDGRIVYTSRVSGHSDVWMMNADGSGQKQLTNNAKNNDIPTVTADGRYIVFVSDRSGKNHIWRMDIDGGNAKQLTNGETREEDATCSPDSQWVFYAASGPSQTNLWRVSIDGGNGVQLTEPPLFYYIFFVSPDGKQIVCNINDLNLRKYRVAILPIEGGQPTKFFDLPRSASLPSPVRWSPDGRSLHYIDTRDGVSNIWYQPVDGGQPKQLTDFKSELIGDFAWSRDGRQLALTRGTETNDAIMISDFK
jgi:eukaryotic-like serine/threonine-protein kinase